MLRAELRIVEQLLDDGLTVIKRTINRNVVHIWIQHCGHLRFLNRSNSAFGVQNEYPAWGQRLI